MVRLKGGITAKISIKYECLPHFCFLCGLLTHTEKNCTMVDEEDKEKGYGWGLDIKASPRKGLHKHTEEIEALKVRKNLFVSKPTTMGENKNVDLSVLPSHENGLPCTNVAQGEQHGHLQLATNRMQVLGRMLLCRVC